MRFRQHSWYASELWDALTAVIRVYRSVDIFRLAGSWRIFRICAVDGHARNLPLLLNRTNLFEDIFHLVVTLKTYRELPGSTIEGDLDARLAYAFRGIHGVYDCGQEFFDCKLLLCQNNSTFQILRSKRLENFTFENQAHWQTIQVVFYLATVLD